MSLLRPFALPVALLAGLSGAFVATGSASADTDVANVVVEVSAARNILSTSGWSGLAVQVRNTGTAPAESVTLTFTKPASLHTNSFQSISDWNCVSATITTCTHAGPFAAGASDRVVYDTVQVDGAPEGSTLEVSASATTTTPESSTADNAASQLIRIVPTGLIAGHLWNDLNADGIRQANEPPSGTGVSIRSQDDEDAYGFSNSVGLDYRETVVSKHYQVTSTLARFSWRLTTPNVGSDDTDSDLVPVSENAFSQTGASPVFEVTQSAPGAVDVGVVASFRPAAITPASVPQGTAAVTVKLSGGRFSSDLEVKLTRAGFDAIPGVISNLAADSASMDVTFPLAQAAAGAWTLNLDRLYGPHAEVPFTVAAPALRLSAAPSIAGTLAVGSTVRAVPGAWTPTAASYSYVWAANGSPVRGATGATLTIPADALGKRLTVQVTAARSGYASATAVSARSVVVAKGKAPRATKRPAITGTVKVGRTARAKAGTWSPKVNSYRYEWRLSGKLIRGATGATLKLTSSMRNKKLTVTVIARKTGYADGRATSAAVKVR
ncbi:hypothetical protein [Krasilnikovia sp. M28-CT-15]|uniref:hypothetical protein n=1 Tax=Krasilnikovia sp. M28-CT-15 TaxID=3373540 RepID=UPI003875D3BC